MKKEVIRRRIVSKTPRIIVNSYNQPIYDMYKIEVEYNTGEKEITNVFCEHDTIDLKIADKRLINEFFGRRLKSLKEEQGRNDYIFLGRVMLADDGRFEFDREYIMPNTQISAQQYFDERAYPSLKQLLEKTNTSLNNQQQAQNSQVSNNPTSEKHYVVGDIHGMYGSYMEIIRKLKPNDHLYIIGDVIDRGNGGIKILKDIINRQDNKESNPQITFLIGNHELQLLQSVSIMQYRGLKSQDIINILWKKVLQEKIDDLERNDSTEKRDELIKARKDIVPYDIEYQKILSDKGLTEDEAGYLYTWLYYNGGQDTLFNYYTSGGVISAEEQRKINQFLANAYVALPQNIGGKDYLFVHSAPPESVEMLRNMKQTGKGYKLSELSIIEFEHILETRDENAYQQAKQMGFTTICGHTPSKDGKIKKNEERGYIRLDAGCGHKSYSNPKLALYCIEDDRVVEYIEPMEEDRGIIPGDNNGDSR